MGTPSATVYFDNSGTPHTFIKLDNGNGKVEYYGFAPATPGSPFGAGTIGVGLTTHAQGDPNNSKAGYIDDAAWSKTIPLTGAQYAAMDSKVSEWRTSTPNYNVSGIFSPNCTVFVKDVLNAGNASYAGITLGVHPWSLVPNNEQGPLFTTDADGIRNFSDAIKNPLTTPGTPAYQYKQDHPELFGPSAPKPADQVPVSYDLYQNDDATWTQEVGYANDSLYITDINGGYSYSCRREDYTTDTLGVDVTTSTLFTAGFNSPAKAIVREADTNDDGAADSIQLLAPQSGVTITQSPTSVPNLASPSTDYLSSTVNSLRDGFRYEDPYLVDATEMRIFVGVQDMSGSWGGARLLEFGTSPLADWYNLDQSDMIGNDFDPSLNGYLGDFGAINFRDYDGNGLVPNWNEGDSTSYMSFGWGLNASPAFSPSDFDDFYGYGGVWDSSFGLDNSWNNDSISLFTIDDGLLFTPVVLDLDGDGIELVKRQDSRAYYDVAGDGFRRNVSWVSPQDGLLAIDKDNNGQIKDADELSFARWTATPNDSDLQGLRTYFDTNSNGLLDSGDGKYSLMRIWRDMNGDGVSDAGELQTLAQAGISTINLYAAPVNFDLQGGAISGFTNFTRSNGQVGWAADVALEYEAEGLKVTGSGSGFVEITSASGLKMMMGTGVLLSVTPSASAGYGGAVLTAGDDFFAFQPASSSVFASAPSLLLEGLGGNDTLYGSWQDDWIDGGTGNDWLIGLGACAAERFLMI